MATPQASKDHYRTQQRLKVVTVASARRLWSRMGEDFDASWRRVAPGLVTLTAAGQFAAAREGAAYVPRVLAETGQVADQVADVVPRRFAGVASDGRSLDGLLYGAVTTAKTASGQGLGVEESLARGGRWLDTALSTIVADASRQSAQVAIAATPRVTGYVRMLNPPSCPNCTILAGRWYRWSAGFERHPGCDCEHIPASEDVAGDLRTDPQAMFEAGQVQGLTKAETSAISEGADFAQVVNARRGRYEGSWGSRKFIGTHEGVTVRGVAGRHLKEQGATVNRIRGQRTSSVQVPRLTPEQIYRDATDRADAIRLLQRFGYLAP